MWCPWAGDVRGGVFERRIRRIVGGSNFLEPKGSEWFLWNSIRETNLTEPWDPWDPPPDPQKPSGKAAPP